MKLLPRQIRNLLSDIARLREESVEIKNKYIQLLEEVNKEQLIEIELKGKGFKDE